MEKNEASIRLEPKKPLVVGNNTFHSTHDFRLTTFDLEIAHQELHETEQMKIKSLRKLKEMLKKDAAVVYCTDDDFLLRYLRVAKFDTGKACKAVKKFYNVKKKYPHLMVISPQLQKFLQLNLVRLLPYKDQDGCFVSCTKIKNWKTEEMSFNDMMQLGFSILDIISMYPCLQVNGLFAIIDCQGITASQVKQILYPTNQILLSELLQIYLGNYFHEEKAKEYLNLQTYFGCALVKSAIVGLGSPGIYPWRVKRVFLVNFNSVFSAFYRIIRPLIKRKITERVIISGSDMTVLHKYINPLLLPKEYGGSRDEEECSITRLIMDNLHYIEYQRSFGAVTEK